MSFVDSVIGLIQANDENCHSIQATLVGHESWVEDTKGSVLVWWCCLLDRSKTLSTLLQKWSTMLDVNQRFSFNGESGWAPLTLAIVSNASAVVSVLLEHGVEWSTATLRPELLRFVPEAINFNTDRNPPKKSKKQRVSSSPQLVESSFPVSWLPFFCGHDDIYRVLAAHHEITAATIAWPTLLDLLSQHPKVATRFNTFIASYLLTWQSQYETASSIALCYAQATMARWLLYAVEQRHNTLIRLLSQRYQTLSCPSFVWSIGSLKSIIPAITTVDMYAWLMQWFPIVWSGISIASRVQWLQSTTFAAPKVYPSTASDVFDDLHSPWSPRSPYLIPMIHDMFRADGHLGVVFHREKVSKSTQTFCDAIHSRLSLFDLWCLRREVDLLAECVVTMLDTYPVVPTTPVTAESIAAEAEAVAAATAAATAAAEAAEASMSPLERMLRSRPPPPPAPTPAPSSPSLAPTLMPQPSVPSAPSATLPMFPSQPVTNPLYNPMVIFNVTTPPQPPPSSTALDCVRSIAEDAILWFHLACYHPVAILPWQQRLQQLTQTATRETTTESSPPEAWRALIHQLWSALAGATSIDELTAADEREYQAQQQQAAEAAAAAAATTATPAATPAAPSPSPMMPSSAAGGYAYAIAPAPAAAALNPAAPAVTAAIPPFGMSPYMPFGMSPGILPAASGASAVLTMTPAVPTAAGSSTAAPLSSMPVAMTATFPVSMATSIPLAAFNPATVTGAVYGGPSPMLSTLASLPSSFSSHLASPYHQPLRPRLRGVPTVLPTHIMRALGLAMRWCFVSGHLPSRWPVLRYLWSEWYLPLLVYRLSVIASQPEAPHTFVYLQMQAVQQLASSLLRIVVVTQHVAPTAVAAVATQPASIDEDEDNAPISDGAELWLRMEAEWQAKVPSPWRAATDMTTSTIDPATPLQLFRAHVMTETMWLHASLNESNSRWSTTAEATIGTAAGSPALSPRQAMLQRQLLWALEHRAQREGYAVILQRPTISPACKWFLTAAQPYGEDVLSVLARSMEARSVWRPQLAAAPAAPEVEDNETTMSSDIFEDAVVLPLLKHAIQHQWEHLWQEHIRTVSDPPLTQEKVMEVIASTGSPPKKSLLQALVLYGSPGLLAQLWSLGHRLWLYSPINQPDEANATGSSGTDEGNAAAAERTARWIWTMLCRRTWLYHHQYGRRLVLDWKAYVLQIDGAEAGTQRLHEWTSSVPILDDGDGTGTLRGMVTWSVLEPILLARESSS